MKLFILNIFLLCIIGCSNLPREGDQYYDDVNYKKMKVLSVDTKIKLYYFYIGTADKFHKDEVKEVGSTRHNFYWDKPLDASISNKDTTLCVMLYDIGYANGYTNYLYRIVELDSFFVHWKKDNS